MVCMDYIDHAALQLLTNPQRTQLDSLKKRISVNDLTRTHQYDWQYQQFREWLWCSKNKFNMSDKDASYILLIEQQTFHKLVGKSSYDRIGHQVFILLIIKHHLDAGRHLKKNKPPQSESSHPNMLASHAVQDDSVLLVCESTLLSIATTSSILIRVHP
jgi:RimJ/RimL family protein N-acetyltransferase